MIPALSRLQSASQNRISRRAFICGGAALLSLPLMPGMSTATPSRDGSILDTLAPRITPEISIINVHTQEKLIDLKFFDRSLGYDIRAIRLIDWIMRDWREKEVKHVDERLIWGLAALSDAARQDGHDGVITLNSGFRTRRTNSSLEGAAQNSLHLSARAADFNMRNVPTSVVSKYAHWLEIGGVGHYRNRFIHIDTGRVRTW